MSKFNVGDWVEITPTPDYTWDEWTKTHDDFCGAIGVIEEVQEHIHFEDHDMIKVVVDFKEAKYDPKFHRYWVWFLKKHVVMSSKEQAETRQHLRKQGSDLQKWEATKKKATDNILSKVFKPKKTKRRKKVKKSVPEDVELWDEKTDPMIPLPDSIIKDDNGVIELPDDDDIDSWFNQHGP